MDLEIIEKSILYKVVMSKKLPVLFVGSGMSRRYLYQYPNWDELLEQSYSKVNPDPFHYQKYKDTLIRNGLSTYEINVELGAIIENEFNEAFFDRKIVIGRNKSPNWVKQGISPYKMYLAQKFKKFDLYDSPKTNIDIGKLKLLKNKLSAVITTNYDLFLEKIIFPTDYKVFKNQNELFSSDSYNIAEIYKVHGCASDAESIIITKNDYDKFKETRKLIIAKMLILFAEGPIIFLGYSFTDENIQSIIIEFLGCLTNKELKNIEEHFIFISYKKYENSLIEIKRTISTSGGEIPITEIQTDNFSLVYDILNQITPGISPVKVRETRRLVKKIVDHTITSLETDSVIVNLDDLSTVDLSGKPLAIAIGYRENILSKIGYGVLDDDLIIEDILYDNKDFDAYSMCFERFKSIATTRLMPVFKYIKKAPSEIKEDSKLYNYISKHDCIEKIIAKNIQKQLKSVPIINDYHQIVSAIGEISDINKKAGLLLKNIEYFIPQQIREICQLIFKIDRQSAIKSTHFKRCIMCLDLLENNKKYSVKKNC